MQTLSPATILSALEIAALRWYAAGTFPAVDDMAPALPLAQELCRKGLLRPSMGGFEPTTEGDLELAIEAIVQPASPPIRAYSKLSGLALRVGDRGGWSAASWRASDRVIARRNSFCQVAS